MNLFVRDKHFYKLLISIGLPIAAQQLITVGVNMMDNIMLGKLGEVQMSGASLANQFISLYQICCMGIGMGASVLISRFWGMGERRSMKKSVKIMLLLAIAFGVVFSVATAIAPGGIMRIFTNEAEVVAAGRTYFLISIPCYLLLGLSLTTSLALRSVGKGNVPLFASIFAFVTNVFFNWVFIFGNLGAPRMEIAGAALGTLIARVVECGIVMGYFFGRDTTIGLRLREFFTLPFRDLLPEYMRICMPVLISDSILGLGNSAVSVVTGHIGAQFVAAMSITTVMQQLSTVIIQGISQASCIITGKTLGEGDVEKTQRQGVTFAALGFSLGIVGCGLILALAASVISLYEIAPETHGIAVQLMDALAVTVIFQCANSILTKGVLRGGGDTKFLMVADVLFLWCASIPLGALAGLVWNAPPFLVFFCLKIDQVIKAIWCLFRLKSRKWIKKIAAVNG